MSAAEFAEWIADYRIEPWGEERDDMRTALAAWRIASMLSTRPLKLEDCLLRFDHQPQSDEAIAALVNGFIDRHNRHVRGEV